MVSVAESKIDKTENNTVMFYFYSHSYIYFALTQIDSDFVQNHSSILLACLRIVPFLSFGDAELMQMLIDHFIDSLNLEK